MSIDQNLLNSGGGIVVAGLLYGAASMYVTGPLVMERMAEKSGWLARCEARVKTELRTRKSSTAETPEISCEDILDSLDPQAVQLIRIFGGEIACQMIDAQNRARRSAEKLKSLALDAALSNKGAACSCALSEVSEAKRGSFAIHAGSARTIRPTAVGNLDGALEGALATPQCAALFKAGGAS